MTYTDEEIKKIEDAARGYAKIPLDTTIDTE
jgi:hypothetical protein